jgi:amidase
MVPCSRRCSRRRNQIRAFDDQAIRLRRMALRGSFAHLLRTVDALLVPVQPFAPLTLAEINTLGEQPALILKLQRSMAPLDLTAHPA